MTNMTTNVIAWQKPERNTKQQLWVWINSFSVCYIHLLRCFQKWTVWITVEVLKASQKNETIIIWGQNADLYSDVLPRSLTCIVQNISRLSSLFLRKHVTHQTVNWEIFVLIAPIISTISIGFPDLTFTISLSGNRVQMTICAHFGMQNARQSMKWAHFRPRGTKWLWPR